MAASSSRKERIAIVGLGGVLPGTRSVREFWENVLAARDVSREPPAGRWALDLADAYSPTLGPDKVNSRRQCYVDEAATRGLNERADEGWLRDDEWQSVLPRLDPMFHLLLAAGRDAWREARSDGVEPSRAGVIIGNIALPTESASKLAEEMLTPVVEAQLRRAGMQLDEAPVPPRDSLDTAAPPPVDPLNRFVAGLPAGVLARALGLRGKTYTLDAACASSLYALKLAADELRAGRADLMLAGGLSRPDPLYTQMGFSQLRAVSSTGRCAPFDHKADGLLVGEGCGIVALKRLGDAIRDGDHIYATIAGIGLSNDIGGNLMSPDSEGQLRAMRAAYEQAGWSPGDVDLIECHGTGTPVGDAVEFESLRRLLGEGSEVRGLKGSKGSDAVSGRSSIGAAHDGRGDGAESPATPPVQVTSDVRNPKSEIVLGSVKSNVGHLLTAAGAAGLIKTLLAMRDGVLPPTANFDCASDHIALDDSPFSVLTEPKPWARRDDTPRRAAVSAFGFGGINAHVLLEEWNETHSGAPAGLARVNEDRTTAEPIAIVGLAAHVGPWRSLSELSRRLVWNDDAHPPRESANWFGLPAASDKRGHFIERVDVPLGRFRIPPTELTDMLPQQLLMLDVAADALDDAGLTDVEGPRLRNGVFIGIGLDLNTTNFHVRWVMLNKARQWARRHAACTGETLSDEQIDAWAEQLRDAVSPPLSANRTMGALGGIVASRIARAFHVGGPSFTVSSEQTSGLHAIDVAVNALRQGDLDTAIVGAVDFAGDPRVAMFADSIASDGAAALILKRESDALRDGDQIYALLGEVDVRNGGDAMAEAVKSAVGQASRPSRASDSSRNQDDRRDARPTAPSHPPVTLDSADTADKIGHTGAAAGVMSLVHGVLCLNDEVLPGADGAPTYWLRDRADGPRRVEVTGASIDGSRVCTRLQQAERNVRLPLTAPRWPAGLFVVEGDSSEALMGELDALAALAGETNATRGETSMHELARGWRQRNPVRRATARNDSSTPPTRRVAIVAREHSELHTAVTEARQSIRERRAVESEPLCYTPTPLLQGEAPALAFVYPGAGNQYAGMSRRLAAMLPSVMRQQDAENARLLSQFAGGRFWSNDIAVPLSHADVIFGQVCAGTIVTDALNACGVKPAAAIGYSLGETTALFATRAWPAESCRDEMLRRMRASTLFVSDLTGRCDAARRAWGLGDDEAVDWHVVVVQASAERVRPIVDQHEHAYLLIINTPDECVIGGDRAAVEAVVSQLGCPAHAVVGVTTVHCEVAHSVREAYHALHVFDQTQPPPGIRWYSGVAGGSYEIDAHSAADSITGQAMASFDFDRVIESAHADGARVFIEVGPGQSCTRMIRRVLGDRPHAARAVLTSGQDEALSLLRTLALLAAHGAAVELGALYEAEAASAERACGGTGDQRGGTGVSPVVGDSNRRDACSTNQSAHAVSVSVGRPSIDVPAPPRGRRVTEPAHSPATPAASRQPAASAEPAAVSTGDTQHPRQSQQADGIGEQQQLVPMTVASLANDVVSQSVAADVAHAQTQQTFLAINQRMVAAIGQVAARQAVLVGQASRLSRPPQGDDAQKNIVGRRDARPTAPHSTAQQPTAPALTEPPRALNREQCLTFAVGRIGDVLGPTFAAIDAHPTRVRLPDEPLMLVDRILAIEGEPHSLSHGRVVTEHDVLPGAWYLDNGRIPTCIAVEAGQADLFLSGYLGIDFRTRGLAVYRLLDAVVTFHAPLPVAGRTIHYDIRINQFFRQGDTHLFRFEFDATADGQSVLTMRDGCAGFFTEAELAGGQGIVRTKLDTRPAPGIAPPDWRWPAPWPREDETESYDDAQLNALRRGDLAACFGDVFTALPLRDPVKLPSGRMTLVHRILRLDPTGGRFGLGQIVGEADIHPDDWFLTCHFVDDRVMPGTLMYECCLHTLRVLLMRMGWVGEEASVVHEPIPGVAGQLKCRGQVIETTKKVGYELTVKEIGYGKGQRGRGSEGQSESRLAGDQRSPLDGNDSIADSIDSGTPYVIADALMYADGKAVVQMKNMSLRLSGLTKEGIEKLWAVQGDRMTGATGGSPASASASGMEPAGLSTPDRTQGVSDPSMNSHGTGTGVQAASGTHPRLRTADRGLRTDSVYDYASIHAFANGKPSDAFGARYLPFDDARRIARLPRSPFQVLDRVVSIEKCEPWELKAGGEIVAEYDVPRDAWYFAYNRQPQMPFAILLEIALQPCGWLAAYLGSALTSDIDLRFRNLGGTAMQHLPVTADAGTLATTVRITNVSQSAGMIIQHYDMAVRSAAGDVYTGNTYFGFFSEAALADQVGIRDAKLYEPTEQERRRGRAFPVPAVRPFPTRPMLMVRDVDLFDPAGGPHGLGFIQGSTPVDPAAWFFRAHFYEDPVWPGSLGLESFIQLLKIVAHDRFGGGPDAVFETLATGVPHQWSYRGQVIPADEKVTVSAVVTDIDDTSRTVRADGFLTVDGRVIYHMKDFAARMPPR